MSPSNDILIDDLAAPVLPEAIRAMNAVPPEEARRRVALDSAGLHAEAKAQTGLSDFGADDYREGMDVFLEALEREADLTMLGRMTARAYVVKLLAGRLRVEATIARDPSILARPFERPVVIVGLPRTGTSHLHNLLSVHPELRFLPYWEACEPIPSDADLALPPGERDPRIARVQATLDQGTALIPHQQAMHELDAHTPHEEIGFFEMDFQCPIFYTRFQVPTYRAWYRERDMTSSYAYVKRVLQVVSALRDGGKRWLLKSPMHLEQLGPLMKVHPGAKVVMTFRDPARVILSLATMSAYGRRLVQRTIDPLRIGREVAAMVQHRFDAAVRDVHLVPAAQRCDVHFDAYMKDPMAAARRVLEFAGLDASEATLAHLRRYQDEHPRGKLGRVVYRYADVGLDPTELRRASQAYRERFGVQAEVD